MCCKMLLSSSSPSSIGRYNDHLTYPGLDKYLGKRRVTARSIDLIGIVSKLLLKFVRFYVEWSVDDFFHVIVR